MYFRIKYFFSLFLGVSLFFWSSFVFASSPSPSSQGFYLFGGISEGRSVDNKQNSDIHIRQIPGVPLDTVKVSVHSMQYIFQPFLGFGYAWNVKPRLQLTLSTNVQGFTKRVKAERLDQPMDYRLSAFLLGLSPGIRYWRTDDTAVTAQLMTGATLLHTGRIDRHNQGNDFTGQTKGQFAYGAELGLLHIFDPHISAMLAINYESLGAASLKAKGAPIPDSFASGHVKQNVNLLNATLSVIYNFL